MEVTLKKEERFEPFTVSIKFETIEEFDVFFNRMDLPAERVRKGLKTKLNDENSALDDEVRRKIMRTILKGDRL